MIEYDASVAGHEYIPGGPKKRPELSHDVMPVPIIRFKVRSTNAWRARRVEPPVGSRGRAPGQGVRGAKPP